MLGGWQIDPAALLELRLSRIHESLSKSQFAHALSEIEELLDEDPTHRLGLFLAGQAALGLGDAVAARAAFQQCAEATPKDPAIQLGLAMASFGCADYSSSLQASQLTCELAPDSAQGWHYQGLVLERIGHSELAMSSFKRAAQLDPESAPLPLSLSETVLAEALKEALRCLPTPIQAFYIQVSLRWKEFPPLAQLTADFPPISPLSGALYQGQPPIDGDPWQTLPEEVCLFSGNLKHPIPAGSSLVERITTALLQEAMSWTGAAAEDILPD